MGGVVGESNAPLYHKPTAEELYFNIVMILNEHLKMDVLSIYNALMCDIFNIYTNFLIHEQKKKTINNPNIEWVTSKNATWH